MLTDAKCRTAKPRAEPYKLPDGKGLYLEVKPNGVKAWRYRFKLARQDAVRRTVQGRSPALTSGVSPKASRRSPYR